MPIKHSRHTGTSTETSDEDSEHFGPDDGPTTWAEVAAEEALVADGDAHQEDIYEAPIRAHDAMFAKDFEARKYLRETCSDWTYARLLRDSRDRMHSLKASQQLITHSVKDNFDRFISCREALDAAHAKMDLEARMLSEEASLPDNLEDVFDTAFVEIKRIFDPILALKEDSDKTRSLLKVLRRFHVQFALPGNVQEHIKTNQLDLVVRDYQKSKPWADTLASDTKIFRRVKKEIDDSLANFRQALFKKLEDPWTRFEEQKHVIQTLIQLDAEPDPAWYYFEHQYDCLCNLLQQCTAEHVRGLRSKGRRPLSEEFTSPEALSSMAAFDETDGLSTVSGDWDRLEEEDGGGRRGLASHANFTAEDTLSLRTVKKLSAILLTNLPDFWKLWLSIADGKYRRNKVDGRAPLASATGKDDSGTPQTIESTAGSSLSDALASPGFPPAQPKAFYLEGWLEKQSGGRIKGWKDRYYRKEGAVLSYFKDNKGFEALGTISLAGVQVRKVADSKKEWCFEIYSPTRRIARNHETYRLAAPSREDLQKWIQAISAVQEEAPAVQDEAHRQEGGDSDDTFTLDVDRQEDMMEDVIEIYAAGIREVFFPGMAHEHEGDGEVSPIVVVTPNSARRFSTDIGAIPPTPEADVRDIPPPQLKTFMHEGVGELIKTYDALMRGNVHIPDEALSGCLILLEELTRFYVEQTCATTLQDLALMYTEENWRMDRDRTDVTRLLRVFERKVSSTIERLIVVVPKEHALVDEIREFFFEALGAFCDSLHLLAFPESDASIRVEVAADAPSMDVRLLLILSNCMRLKDVVPSLTTLFCNKFRTSADEELQQTLSTIDHLEDMVFRKYIQRQTLRINSMIKQGVLLSGWPKQKVKNVRPYIMELLLNLVIIHAEVHSRAKHLVKRVLRALFQNIAQGIAACVLQLDRLDSNFVVQVETEVQFVEHILKSYSTPIAEAAFAKVHLLLTHGDVDSFKQTMQKAIEPILEALIQKTTLQFVCFHQESARSLNHDTVEEENEESTGSWSN